MPGPETMQRLRHTPTSVGYWPRLSQLQSVVLLLTSAHSKTTTGATDRAAKADLEWSPVFQQLGSSAFLKVQASSFTMWQERWHGGLL